ncbi:MAG: tRNA lysidine(34) synthetase TilS [Proteobacteria bacterium]|nr:tRNA lysidine(34) synthetase TilS [Pseudomonadota bacterium]MCP4915763.1 tRNA lysidine(34) synthetase TilS [Pseudomonadota bacterium]
MIQRIRRFAAQHDLFRGELVASVSGGPDSMALLHVLVLLGRRPSVLTFDHGLREESVRECALVKRTSEGLGLDCRVVALHLESGPDLAARARAARLSALPDAESIALGHHADDQAETVLDRLMRGSGARGLAAMRPRNGRLVRPLLCVTRADIDAFLSARDIPFVVDPSNVAGTRGAIRTDILPALEALRPSATRGLARSATHLAQDDALLEELAQELVGDGVRLDGPAPLVRRALLAHIRATRGHGETHSRALDAAQVLVEGAGVDIGGGWRLERRRGRVRCVPSRTSRRDDVDPVST